MTVGFFAPMPPARTGVADYAAALLGALRKHGHVEVAPDGCDAAVYHIGNNRLHSEIYRRALERPGVVVLHDAVLNHLLLGEMAEREYVEEFVHNYGEWNRGLGRELWRGRAASGTDARYFQYPILKRIAESARAVVVHNPAAARMVREHAPQTAVVEIPHLFEPPELPAAGEVEAFRQRIGVSAGDFLFGVFGYIRETKRLIPILEAFAKVRQQNPRVALLVAGSFASAELERAAVLWMGEPGIIRLPHLPARDFWLAASAVDACINLRYPSAGETSGIAIRLMGVGRAVLLTESEENARFPEDACIRIPAGLAEGDSLRSHMVLLPSKPGLSSEIGRRAADFVRTQHSVGHAARLYWNTLCAHCT